MNKENERVLSFHAVPTHSLKSLKQFKAFENQVSNTDDNYLS